MGGVGLGGQSGCERRIEVFVKVQKKKKIFFFFWGGGGGSGGQWEGSGWGGGGRVGGWSVAEGVRWGDGVGKPGVRVDMNAMLGVGVMWGMGDVNQE